MRARACWAVVVGWASVATAEPKPSPVDIKPIRDQLIVLQDGQGGTYLVRPGAEARVFFSSGKAFYEQVVTGRTANGDAWMVDTWAPRVAELRPGSIQRRDDGTFRKWCGQTETPLTVVPPDKAKTVLDKGTFLSSALVRRPHLLARDDAGVYYYVDRIREQYGGKGFRVFVGKKGAMKLTPLTDVATDTAGEVFSTKTGDLRLVHAESSEVIATAAKWIHGDKKTELTVLDVDRNSPLIFKDLGIYDFIGTICDDIP